MFKKRKNMKRYATKMTIMQGEKVQVDETDQMIKQRTGSQL